jgi:hypothetical protein
MFRLVGSDAMRRDRATLRRTDSIPKLLPSGLFRADATTEHAEFVTPHAQLPNQRPELVNR